MGSLIVGVFSYLNNGVSFSILLYLDVDRYFDVEISLLPKIKKKLFEFDKLYCFGTRKPLKDAHGQTKFLKTFPI